ncbi:DUF4376 domain-containing protein [Acidovorax sp. SUPP2522]|uniref:hypothetical protein n=1 Tax=unclassified Acidovorax TaxID=2684926 RepID=UPI00234A65DF|nr:MULTISPECIES: hypothetical protein [unclassified Acidovorax]WCM99990.1 hypothetical protein M5C96_11645 [Acidovorax sp. GBBC 1281]GKT18544.1 DUF4376 domain-containing protein [Acidovorax sp. SUPP2522]
MRCIHLATGAYPLTPEAIMAEHPQCSFPIPFAPPDGYAEVVAVEPPKHDPTTHRAAERAPIRAGGVWRQGWQIVPLTVQEQADRAVDVAAQFKAQRADKIAAINAEYDRRTAAISAGYPASERESWPVQTREARALLADAGAVTPWIDAAASARGLDRADLARRIAALDEAYRAVHGALTGTRQRLEGLAWDAQDPAALQAISPAAGWGTPTNKKDGRPLPVR